MHVYEDVDDGDPGPHTNFYHTLCRKTLVILTGIVFLW